MMVKARKDFATLLLKHPLLRVDQRVVRDCDTDVALMSEDLKDLLQARLKKDKNGRILYYLQHMSIIQELTLHGQPECSQSHGQSQHLRTGPVGSADPERRSSGPSSSSCPVGGGDETGAAATPGDGRRKSSRRKITIFCFRRESPSRPWWVGWTSFESTTNSDSSRGWTWIPSRCPTSRLVCDPSNVPNQDRKRISRLRPISSASEGFSNPTNQPCLGTSGTRPFIIISRGRTTV